MFERIFSHYISYGATDQETARELTNHYDGLLVPGTVAAFQRQGTGGFVLTLSARSDGPDYAIDPRFPLFQQPLSSPKKSHEELAAILGHPGLVSTSPPSPDNFTDEVVESIARNWVSFNRGYDVLSGEKFAKYAKRLGEPVSAIDSKLPHPILAPYFSVEGVGDPWWGVSQRLLDATKSAAAEAACVRVVAVQSWDALAPCLLDNSDSEAAIWVSGLNELEQPAADLAGYLDAIGTVSAHNMRLFALYGGFFAVLASTAGLVGASHGIGYGESRSWLELPQSGPPPARFYLPQIHRYVSQELAYQLWLEDHSLAHCECSECDGEPPIALEYHSLMKHSVLCRHREIRDWVGLSSPEMAARLRHEHSTFVDGVRAAGLPPYTERSVIRQTHHLARWVEALEMSS